jgi:hypothetical protein
MSKLRVRLEVAALQLLLTTLGVLMALASGRADRFRRQVTRDLVLEIRSADGARQQYRLHAATRRLTLPRRPAQPVECTLIFPTARESRSVTTRWSCAPATAAGPSRSRESRPARRPP